MAQATIRDVAREADVSVASVSRALNGHNNVRPELRKRVEDAAARLGYVPHAGARSLSLARAQAIGVMLPDLHGEFFSEVVRGMDREASARGLQLLLSNMHADPDHAVDAMRAMRGRVDGLVIMAPDLEAESLLAHAPPSMPTVLMSARGNSGHAAMQVDNEAAAQVMVQHLLETGRRNIVHLSGPAFNAEASDRAAGYRAAMVAAGLEPRVIEGDFTEDAGVRAIGQLLAEDADVDALFAGNDMMAIGALVALRDAGIAVPGQMAVAGFDDIPLARLISPALSTMRVDIATLGGRAIERLAAIIDGADDHAVERRMPQLVVRETTGPAQQAIIIEREGNRG